MTSLQREVPMSVGISSHSVPYTRDLKHVSDQGVKEAIKVFSVNPGIDDEIEVNGTQTSLINLVGEMTQRLSSIEELLNVGNTQRSSVVAATTTTMTEVSKLNSGGSGNPFTQSGFSNSLGNILQGE